MKYKFGNTKRFDIILITWAKSSLLREPGSFEIAPRTWVLFFLRRALCSFESPNDWTARPTNRYSRRFQSTRTHWKVLRLEQAFSYFDASFLFEFETCEKKCVLILVIGHDKFVESSVRTAFFFLSLSLSFNLFKLCVTMTIVFFVLGRVHTFAWTQTLYVCLCICICSCCMHVWIMNLFRSIQFFFQAN